MGNPEHQQGAFYRARGDWERVAQRWWWQVVGLLFTGCSGGMAAFASTNWEPSTPQVVAITVVGIVGGAALWIIVTFAFVFIRAPYRQRNEARAELAAHGTQSPAAAMAALAGTPVILNGHRTDYAAVLRTCWQKLAQGATEATIEYELHHHAFLPPSEQAQDYLVAEPDLDDFFGNLRLLKAVELITVRVPANPFRTGPRVNINSLGVRGMRGPQEVVGPTDEQRYTLTDFGLLIVQCLTRSPTPNAAGSRP